MIKYYIQKLLGYWLDKPVFKKNSTVGFSLVRSERANCKVGLFTKVYPPFFLHDIRLGDYSYIARNSCIANCEIGRFCSIGPNFCCGLGIHPSNGLSTSPMFYSTAKQNGISLCEEDKMKESARTTIGNDVFIGANVTVLDGIHISDGAIVGAGAVVVDDIPPYAIAVGVPARVVKYRFEKGTINRLLERKWWDGSLDDFKDVERMFWHVHDYLTSQETEERV